MGLIIKLATNQRKMFRVTVKVLVTAVIDIRIDQGCSSYIQDYPVWSQIIRACSGNTFNIVQKNYQTNTTKTTKAIIPETEESIFRINIVSKISANNTKKSTTQKEI